MKQILSRVTLKNKIRRMSTMPNQYKYRELKEFIIDLQCLGVCLKAAIVELPGSVTKQFLAFESKMPIEINTVANFYLLQRKVESMLNTAVQDNIGVCTSGENVINILKSIRNSMTEISSRINEECFS